MLNVNVVVSLPDLSQEQSSYLSVYEMSFQIFLVRSIEVIIYRFALDAVEWGRGSNKIDSR